MFFFPNQLSFTKDYVQRCSACQRRKGAQKRHAHLHSMPEANEPMDRVSADLMDLHQSYSGKRYVLSIVDHLSRYVQLIALPDKQAETVANAFIQEYVTLFGAPKVLVTDNGSEFNNRLFAEVCKLVQIKASLTTPFHPSSNGMIERIHRTIKDSLSILSDESPLSWDEYLPYVRYALNSAIHRSVNAVPLYLFTGHNCNPPSGLISRITRYDDDGTFDTLRKLHMAWKTASTHSQLSRATEARYHNKRVKKSSNIDVGTLVLKRNYTVTKGASRALAPKWAGPFRVAKKTGPVTFIIKTVFGVPAEHKVHLNQLKRFYPSEELVLDVNCDDDDVDDNFVDSNPDPISFTLLSLVKPREHSMITRSQGPAKPI